MKKGFTLVEIMIVVAIIGLLAAIAIPSFMRARTTSQKNACINNLRQIDAGKDQYALEHCLINGASIEATDDDATAFGLLINVTEGYLKTFPNCPASTNLGSQPKSGTISAQDYTINVMGVNPVCDTLPGTSNAPLHALR